MGNDHIGPIPPAVIEPEFTSQSVTMPDGFNTCEQSQIDDLKNNFTDQLNEVPVVSMEYCYAQVVQDDINYKVSLKVEVDTGSYLYDHYNIEENTDDQYTIMCE